MLSIIITSYKEPKTIVKAIESFLNQDITEKFELIVSAPDKETLDIAKKYAEKHKQLKIFQDPGKGKSYALNLLLPKLKGEIVILTDGDVFVSRNSVSEILEKFKDKKVGCVSGQPASINSKQNILGYWSHILTHAAHKLRQKRDKQNNFLECSGYLWAFRNNIIKRFPLDVAEDSIIPILFWKKNYKIKYAEKAIVYVKYPTNLKDTIEQRRRAMQSHEKLYHYAGDFPKMKSFSNEVFNFYEILFFPKSIKEFLWLFFLFPVRFCTWILANYKFITKKEYQDAWKRVESTK